MKKKLQSIKSFCKQGGHIKFNKKYILFHDSEVTVQVPYRSRLDVVVDATTLLNLFSSDLDFETEIEEDHVLFQNKTMNVRLPIVDVEVPEMENVNFKPVPDDFMTALDFCSVSISNSISDGILTCFYLAESCYSCDNYRITEYFLSEKMDKFLLPNNFYKRIKNFNIAEYCTTNNALYFKSDNIIIRTNIIKDDYIDIEDMFDANGPIIGYDLDKIKTLIEHSCFLIPSDKKSREEFVELKFDKTNISCISQQANGSSEETTASNNSYPEISLKINPHLFLQIIDKAKSMRIGDGVLVFSGDNFKHSLCLGGE